MFHIKNHKQLNIFDPWEHLGPKRRKNLKEKVLNKLYEYYEKTVA